MWLFGLQRFNHQLYNSSLKMSQNVIPFHCTCVQMPQTLICITIFGQSICDHSNRSNSFPFDNIELTLKCIELFECDNLSHLCLGVSQFIAHRLQLSLVCFNLLYLWWKRRCYVTAFIPFHESYAQRIPLEIVKILNPNNLIDNFRQHSSLFISFLFSYLSEFVYLLSLLSLQLDSIWSHSFSSHTHKQKYLIVVAVTSDSLPLPPRLFACLFAINVQEHTSNQNAIARSVQFTNAAAASASAPAVLAALPFLEEIFRFECINLSDVMLAQSWH